MIAPRGRWWPAAVVVACASFGSGCYWSHAPTTPHRSVRIEIGPGTELGAPRLPMLSGRRTLVLGRFDTSATNPIGGLYDRNEFSVSPLQRTYFFRDGAVELFEHVSDALRSTGLSVLKDYAGAAQPALVEPRTRALRPLLVNGTVWALQHDQIREKGDEGRNDHEAGTVDVELRVAEVDGTVLFTKRYAVTGHVPWDGRTEFLRLLGFKLVEAVLADAAFVRAIEASQIGSAIPGGTR